jgi:FkbM family methyltransferase
MLRINKVYENQKAIAFCKEFLQSTKPKYIFGINQIAKVISEQVAINGFIDEFTVQKNYLDKPIVSLEAVEDDALVVIVVALGKPLIAEKKVSQYQFDFLDCFSFLKYSGLEIQHTMFSMTMAEDIQNNFAKYEWIYKKLEDQISKNQFYNLINFKFSYDLDYMRGFEAIEERQYFEEFLDLGECDEVFVDIGAYDGYTTQEFIKRAPKYKGVLLFEPEAKNMELAKARLEKFENIRFYILGLSDKKETLRFDTSGSGSKLSEQGDTTIEVDTLDSVVQEKITFIKMDIEGAETKAIEGAMQTIKLYHPKLAISVYHKSSDFWKIPQQILAIRDDYTIYLRHYTEGTDETVMFFIPKKEA